MSQQATFRNVSLGRHGGVASEDVGGLGHHPKDVEFVHFVQLDLLLVTLRTGKEKFCPCFVIVSVNELD